MSLVDRETGEIVEVLDADEARALIGRIRQSVAVFKTQVLRLHDGRAWLALGYGTWDEMCEAELDGVISLPRLERQEFHIELRNAGMSTRAIAAVTGASTSTVHEDTRCSIPNTSVTGLDGKQYQPNRPSPPSPGDDDLGAEADGSEDDPGPGDADDREASDASGEQLTPTERAGDCTAPGPDLAHAAETINALLDDDPDVQNALWRKNFMRALTPLTQIPLYDPEAVVAHESPTELDDLGRWVDGLNAWHGRVVALRSRPLRSISGGRS